MKSKIHYVGVLLLALCTGYVCYAQKASAPDNVLLPALNSGASLDDLSTLVADGASLEERDSRQATMAHIAAQNGRMDVLQWLRARGADFNSVDVHGLTPLHYALAYRVVWQHKVTRDSITIWQPFHAAEIIDFMAEVEDDANLDEILEYSGVFNAQREAAQFLVPLSDSKTVDNILARYDESILESQQYLKDRAQFYQKIQETPADTEVHAADLLQKEAYEKVREAVDVYVGLQTLVKEARGLEKTEL